MAWCEKDKSKIKMVVLTVGTIHDNLTWYSPKNQNNLPTSKIIDGMKRRISEYIKLGKLAGTPQVIQFYENGTLIENIKVL